MNRPDNFDELSRHKLAEREFPFDEAHWLDVQRSLQATDRRRAGAWVPWSIGAVLLLSGALWWVMADPPAQQNAGVQQPGVTNAPAQPPAEANTRPIGAVEDRGGDDLGGDEQGGALEPSAPVGSTAFAATPVDDVPKTRASGERGRPEVSRSIPTSITDDHEAAAVNAERNIATFGTTTGAEIQVTATEMREVPEKELSNIDRDNTTATGSKGADTKDPGSAEPLNAVVSGTGSPDSVPQAPAADPPVAEIIAAAQPGSESDSVVSALIAEPEAITSSHAHWEISALAGALSTWSAYKGGNSVEWTNALSNGRTGTYGAEAMRMGHNTGIGAGIHYSAYAERFSEADRFRTVLDYRNYYFLEVIDTTVTIVVDTAYQGNDTLYVTQQVSTSLQVLGSGVDTIANTERTSEARTHVNVVSYLEIPLLLDAHVVQGRWSLGIRGGPFLGILSGRRGALPNGAWDGYTDLADQPFRSLMLGWTARAYLRYRFNAAWSLGLEPCARGQFLDAFEGGAVTRRSMGAGLMMSLTYGLR